MTTRTGTELIDDLIDRADLSDMEVRHPRARLLQYINVSLAAVRAELTRGGFSGLLDWSTPAALPTTPPVTGQNYLEVSWPTRAVSIHGVDVNAGSSGAGAAWYPLDTMVLAERRTWYGTQGPPRAFLIRSLPRETSPSSAALDTTTGKIQIFPASTLGLEYQVIYLPEFPPLTVEAHIVQGFDGDWLEWALWNAAILALFKDDEMDPSQDQKAVREREMVGQRMLTNITRTNRAGPIQPHRAGGIRFRR
jgi:hypothetical protein